MILKPTAIVMPRFHCRVRNGSDRKGAVGRGRYSPAQFRGRVSAADSTLGGRPDVDRRGSYVNIRDGQNDSFPGTSSFSSVHYNDSFI